MQIKMFMWEWQHIFQPAVFRLLVESLRILKIQASPKTFVIGIPINEDANNVYFHPENCGYTPQQFQAVFSMVNDAVSNDPRQGFFITAPLNLERKSSLYLETLQKIVENIVNENDSTGEFISFCSFPVEMNNHWIMTVIQIEKEVFYEQYQLTRAIHEVHAMRYYRIDRSFLEAIIWVILSESQRELQMPSKERYDSFAEPERILEDAASNLLSSIRLHIDDMGGDLLELANAISAERYEGLGSKGRLVICRRDNPHILIKINLKVPISINNYRGIRKLLEVSSETMALLCDAGSVWGLGLPLGTYDLCNEDLFEIKFTEHYTWELVHAEHVMLIVKYRKPRLPRKRFDKEQFCDHVNRLFNVHEEALGILIEAVESAVEQRHGTMLVITTEADQESERLSAQSTVITPTPVSRELISHVSSVDGAILISPDGIVYSFGVILDGLFSKNGDRTRGARYNSAIRYIDGKNNSNIKCLAIIVSEDGYVNIYPTLKQRISRTLIDELIEDLEKHADLSKRFDGDGARATLLNLEKLSFYLLKKDIERVNTAKNIAVDRMNKHSLAEAMGRGMGCIFDQFNDFHVHEEMNHEYYLPINSCDSVMDEV
ncbi:MAG: hypothetical protein DCF19_08380 [Pseudanabaena frigida]|uniref:DAC domain-containing protein n=1 Tax=Pseudanabaena frigida TaxID=945775 RepID=A0A2W4WFC6_9CYAN|nr:MAG: hypothetical protein DCF19_08380 [Pseudanabaena frigida]